MLEQAALFPAEADEYLLKHVNAVALMPVKGGRRITALGRKLFSVLLHRAQEEGEQDEYQARLHEVIASAGYNSKDADPIRKVLRELMSTTVEWQSPTNAEVETWDACNLLSGAGTTKDKRTGAVTVRWRYDSKIRGQLLSPDRYARLSLEAITQLSSHAAMALYEICARYVDNPSHKTARQHWRWWKPVLTGVAGDDSKAEYRFFKRDVLARAVAEINACTNIEIRGPIEHKERDNRTIAEIQFEVYLKDPRPVRSAPRRPEGMVVDDLPIIGRGINLGLGQREVEKLIEQFGPDRVTIGLDELDKRIKMPSEKVGLVHKPGGWLKAHLARTINTPESAAPTDSPVTPEELKARRAAWTDEWLRRLKSRLQAGFKELPAAEREVLLDDFRQVLSAAKQAQLLRRFEMSGWEHRMVIGAFIKFYADRTLRADWDKPTQDEIMMVAVEQIKTAGSATSNRP